jgi:hypothetical protein
MIEDSLASASSTRLISRSTNRIGAEAEIAAAGGR